MFFVKKTGECNGHNEGKTSIDTCEEFLYMAPPRFFLFYSGGGHYSNAYGAHEDAIFCLISNEDQTATY